MAKFTRLFILSLASLLLALPSRAADPPSQTAADVKIETAGKGWAVFRTKQKETRAVLVYSYEGHPPTEVTGSQDGESWKFAITEKVPSDAVVSLEFLLFSPVPDPTAAQQAVVEFSTELARLLADGFPAAARAAESVPDSERRDQLVQILGVRIRSELSTLIRNSKLSTYYANGQPAPEYVLAKLAFRQLGPATWEPTTESFHLLKANFDLLSRRVGGLEQTVAVGPPAPLPACAGDSTLIRADSDDGAAARARALKACLKTFVDEANLALTARDKVVKGRAVTPALAATAQSLLAIAAKSDDAEIAKEAFGAATTELADGLGEGFSKAFGTKISELLTAATVPVTPLPKQDSITAHQKAAQDAYLVLHYLGARAVIAAQKAARDEARTQELRASVSTAITQLELVERMTRTDHATDIFVVDPGKPRFFLSTGLALSDLRAAWKLSIPAVVSICFSRAGCETKGIGSGGNALNYFTADVGLKTIFLGASDRREGSPSFLLGVGVTPLYATHLSIGMNLFENRQREHVNAALYFALTFDTVDGAGILGDLGIGKPEAKRIEPSSK
ncbi:MAG TPA: hypothetical protein VG937_07985 [Polyangiaceae bacterium]|nr:hypothetical protein [Polyangiaceae bacterium]